LGRGSWMGTWVGGILQCAILSKLEM